MNHTTKKYSRVELQERDLDFFQAIHDLRFATVEHLAALFPRAKPSSSTPIRKQNLKQAKKPLPTACQN